VFGRIGGPNDSVVIRHNFSETCRTAVEILHECYVAAQLEVHGLGDAHSSLFGAGQACERQLEDGKEAFRTRHPWGDEAELAK